MSTYGSLWPIHFLSWMVCLPAYRILMTWVYSRTGSVVVGQTMHAAFTGSQLLLGPAGAPPLLGIAWYGVFAVACWGAVGIVWWHEGAAIGASRGSARR